MDAISALPSLLPNVSLARYDAMCRAIDAAYEVDEVKGIRDQAIALELYANQAKNTEAERRACEIRLRAERKAGELLTMMDKAKGGRPAKTGAAGEQVSTLADHGISRAKLKHAGPGSLRAITSGRVMDALTPQAISFVVPGVPVPWARAGSKSGIRFTPAKQRAHMAQVKQLAAAAMGSMRPLEGPVALSIRATWTPPASWSAKKQAEAKWKTGRPDYDNLGKIIADSLNGIAYLDDAQVVSGHVWKTYGPHAELAVRVEAVR